MSSDGLRERGDKGADGLLLARLCPSRTHRGHRFEIRKTDSKIYYQGAFRNISKIIDRRSKQVERERRRYQNKDFRKWKCAKRREEYAKNPDRERKRWRDFYANQSEDRRKQWSKRRWENAVAQLSRRAKRFEWEQRRNPTYGISSSISDFASGKLSIQELNRRYATALALIDERCRDGRAHAQDERTDDSSDVRRSETDARPYETEA